jgi:hypothetical protein
VPAVAEELQSSAGQDSGAGETASQAEALERLRLAAAI